MAGPICTNLSVHAPNGADPIPIRPKKGKERKSVTEPRACEWAVSHFPLATPEGPAVRDIGYVQPMHTLYTP